MKILLDENLPIKLKSYLKEYKTFTVRDMNWNSFKNGKLLDSAVKMGFNVMITTDKNLQYQQNILKIGISVIVLDVLLLKWSYIEPLIPKIIDTLAIIKKGEVCIIK